MHVSFHIDIKLFFILKPDVEDDCALQDVKTVVTGACSPLGDVRERA